MQHTDLGPPRNYWQKTALVVNNRTEERDALERFLANSDYHVLTTADTGDAVEICRNYGGALHLLITDVDLPNSANGYDLASVATKLRPGLVVLFLSATVLSGPGASGSSGAMDPAMLLGVARALAVHAEFGNRRN
jgi:CheY-like chemotaxis protein